MKKRNILLPLLSALIVCGCGGKNNGQPSAVQGEIAAAQDSAAVRADAKGADNFKKIEVERYWLAAKADPGLNIRPASQNSVKLTWPTHLAGVDDMRPLHAALLRALFGDDHATDNVAKAVERFATTPLYAVEEEGYHIPAEWKHSAPCGEQEYEAAAETGGGWACEAELKMAESAPEWAVFEAYSYTYMGGAAHGIYQRLYVAVSRKDGTVFGADNSFTDKKRALSLLNGKIKEEGRKRGTEYWTAESLPTWYPKGNGLVFVFQPYEIAPYAAGNVSIALPAAELKECLTPALRKALGV